MNLLKKVTTSKSSSSSSSSSSATAGVCNLALIYGTTVKASFDLKQLLPTENLLSNNININIYPYSSLKLNNNNNNKEQEHEDTNEEKEKDKYWYKYDIIVFYELEFKKELELLLPIIIKENQQYESSVFTIVYHKNAFEDVLFRQECTNLGVNMITFDPQAFIYTCQLIADIVKQIHHSKSQSSNTEEITYDCSYPNCFTKSLSLYNLWRHCPLYHIATPNSIKVDCPICIKKKIKEPFQVHLHNEHGPPNHIPECNYGTSSYIFSLVVVRRPSDQKYLLVQEYGDCGFWLPGGRVDPGEEVCAAAIRETQEEGGINIQLKGILKIEFQAIASQQQRENSYNRIRVIFYAEPLTTTTTTTTTTSSSDSEEQKQSSSSSSSSNDTHSHSHLPPISHTSPKSIPNYESIGACWVSISQLNSGKVRLRGQEPVTWFNYVDQKKPIYPLDILRSTRTER